jgi:hypothetical protein
VRHPDVASLAPATDIPGQDRQGRIVIAGALMISPGSVS